MTVLNSTDNGAVSLTKINDKFTEIDASISAVANNTFINIKNYGAVGDGVTDDATSIQNAINHANSLGGGTIFFPSGTYIIGTTILMYSSIKLIGDGIANPIGTAATTIKAKTNLNSDMFNTQQSSGMTFENLAFNANKAAQS